ncbi:MAG: hypothetical protein SGPRY_013889 [Prymnesium sp.]
MNPIEPDAILAALKGLRKAIASQLRSEMAETYESLSPAEGAPFTIEPEVVGIRHCFTLNSVVVS